MLKYRNLKKKSKFFLAVSLLFSGMSIISLSSCASDAINPLEYKTQINPQDSESITISEANSKYINALKINNYIFTDDFIYSVKNIIGKMAQDSKKIYTFKKILFSVSNIDVNESNLLLSFTINIEAKYEINDAGTVYDTSVTKRTILGRYTFSNVKCCFLKTEQDADCKLAITANKQDNNWKIEIMENVESLTKDVINYQTTIKKFSSKTNQVFNYQTIEDIDYVTLGLTWFNIDSFNQDQYKLNIYSHYFMNKTIL